MSGRCGSWRWSATIIIARCRPVSHERQGNAIAITTLDGLIAGLPGQDYSLFKTFTPQAAGCWTSLWTIAGYPGAAATPTATLTGEIPTDATAGALPFTNSATTYLARLFAGASVSGVLLLYDRLWQNSGLSPTTVGNQTINSIALDRPDANGAGVEAWFQVYTVMGAGSTTPTMVYTDQGGTATNTGTLQGFATTAAVGRTFPFSLAAGDTGVRSIQTYDNVATQTSGNAGLVLRRRIAALSVLSAAGGFAIDAIQAALPRVYDNAALELVWFSSATTAMTLQSQIVLAQG